MSADHSTVSARSGPPGASTVGRWTALLAALGFLVIEVGWVLAMPPFRGQDEHDHVFRADAVAHGSWRPGTEHVDGSRGGLVPVRRSIAEPALAVCRTFGYTTGADCTAHPGDSAATVLVPSGAAIYDPVPYAVLGAVARPFDGTAALYVMRLTAAVLCAAGVGWAALLALRLGAGRLTTVALVALGTPTVTMSAASASPNGLECVAGVLTWVAALGIARTLSSGEPVARAHLVGYATGVAALALCHPLGGPWAVLVTVLAVLSAPLESLLRGGWAHRHTLLPYVGLAVAVVLASALWTASSGGTDPSGSLPHNQTAPFSAIAAQPLVWLLQLVFPWTSGYVPLNPLVYGIGWAVFVAVLVAVWRGAAWRARTVAATTAVCALIIPLALSAYSWSSLGGFSWQGRYDVPLAVGVLLAPLMVSRVPRDTVSRRLVWTAVAGGSVVTAFGQLEWLRAAPPSEGAPAGVLHLSSGGPLLLMVLVVVGTLLLGVPALVGDPGLRRRPSTTGNGASTTVQG